jgi:hypothetical protein
MNLSVSKILAAIQIFWGIVAADVTWYVSIEGEIGAATFLICGYYLPDARSTTCIVTALVSAIRVGVSQGNNYGVTESPLTSPQACPLPSSLGLRRSTGGNLQPVPNDPCRCQR